MNNADDLHGEPPFFTTKTTMNVTAYHCDRDCTRFDAESVVIERPESYVRYHDLKPCEHCHDEFDPYNDRPDEDATHYYKAQQWGSDDG